MIDTLNDLELLEYWLTDPSSPIYADHHYYVIVPDLRLYTSPYYKIAKPFFSRWSKVQSVFVLEKALAIYGSWGGSSLVYKEIIAYLKSFELNLDYSHAILTSATALPVKTINEMLTLYKENTSYYSIWNSEHHTKNKIQRSGSLFYDCGGCVYNVTGATKKQIYSRLNAPPMLQKWQNKIMDDVITNDRVTNPLIKGSQWKSLTKSLLQDALLGTKAELFQQYFQYFETVWISDELLWPTFLKYEYQNNEKSSS
eukprot:Pgem_evm1s1513